MIDQASVFAERYKSNPQVLQATVLGHGGDPRLDPYTALRALQLIKESNQMAMARQAQQPTSAPSLLSDAMTPPQPPAMPMGAPVAQGQPPQGMPPQGQAPQGMPQGMPQGPAPQAPVMQASGGLAGMYTPEEHYAGGGILAFADEGLVDSDAEPRSADASDSSRLAEQYRLYGEGKLDDGEDTGSDGSQTDQARFNRLATQRLDALAKYNPKEMSAEDQEAFLTRYITRARKEAGPDIYAPAESDLTSREEARKSNMGQMSGLALLQAAGAVLKGRNLAEGASNAAPAYASAMGEAIRADQAEKRSMEQMKFALADARRKENQGYHRDANAALGEARKFQADANKAGFDRDKALAEIAVRGSAANRPLRSGAGAGAGGLKLAEQLAAAEIAFNKDPSKENKQVVEGLRRAAGQMRSMTSSILSESGPVKAGTSLTVGAAPVQEKVDASVAAAMKIFGNMDSAYRRAKRTGNAAEAQRLWSEEEARQRAIFKNTEGVTGNPLPAPIRGTASPRTSAPPPPPGFNLNSR